MNFAFNLYNAHYYYPPPATRFRCGALVAFYCDVVVGRARPLLILPEPLSLGSRLFSTFKWEKKFGSVGGSGGGLKV
jgi:hypothetical protein